MVEIKLSEKNYSKKIDAIIEKGESFCILVSGNKAKIIKKGIFLLCKLNLDNNIISTGIKKGKRLSLLKLAIYFLLNPYFWGGVGQAMYYKEMTLDYNENTEGLMVLLQNSSKGQENFSD